MAVVCEIVERALGRGVHVDRRRELEPCHVNEDIRVRTADGRVSVEDSVAIVGQVSGKELRDRFVSNIAAMSLGLVRMRGNSMRFGPIEILRFGRPKVTRTGVEWPIEGGLAAGAAGGQFGFRSAGGRVVATLDGYRPRLPLSIYAVTQRPFHHLVMRLHLLWVRGRVPSPGVPAGPARRLEAGAIDVALCAAVAMTAGRGRRLPALVGITLGYHVACWSISGRTVGGLITGQRVVSVDGSRVSAGQSLVRLAALPLAALRLRAVHDQVAGTEVVAD